VSEARTDAVSRTDYKERYRALKAAHDELTQQTRTLRDSYYLSGARKKIDIAVLPGFGEIAAAVIASGRAGMDLDRLYTLWQAVEQAPSGAPVVEVGTYKGGSARFLAESFRRRSEEPRFYVCDTFAGHAQTDERYDLDKHRDGSKFQNTSAADVAAYLAGFANITFCVGDIIETARRELAHEPQFGLVHVDVDVYPPTDFCLRFFAPRLAPGAWLVVDDYGFTTCPGAKRAVDDFIAAHREFRMLHLLTGQAVVFRSA